MFHYTVYTEQQAMEERFSLLKEGEYDAVIMKSEDRVSSSGNPMMDMTLHVYDENGKEHPVRDFLVFTKAMMWKVVHFANSAGLLTQYEAGQLCSENAMGNRVRVNIGIEPGSVIGMDKLNGKAVGSKYPDKNKVVEYIKREDQKPLVNNVRDEHAIEDDDIPF